MSLDTTLIEPEQPRPRNESLQYLEHLWSVLRVEEMGRKIPLDPVSATLCQRRTRREFGPIDDQALAALLWPIAGCIGSVDSGMGFSLEHRGVPSAGAIHPIHILICDPSNRQLVRYDGHQHALQRLAQQAPLPLLQACHDVLPPQEGTLLFFVAEPGKTYAKYTGADTLVWRDAGIVQGAIVTVAEALGLNVSLLGITGDPWVSQLSKEGKLVGVGVAVVGTRT